MSNANVKLSPAQTRMWAAVQAAGPEGLRQPENCGNRASVQALSAWHRTANSLKAKGLLTLRHNGSVYWAVANP